MPPKRIYPLISCAFTTLIILGSPPKRNTIQAAAPAKKQKLCYNAFILFFRQIRSCTEGETVKTADLRRTLLSCNDRLLEIGGEHLYYTRETNAPGCHRLSLLVYSQAAKSSRTLASYLIMKPEYRMHSFAFPDSVLVVMENGDSEAWILKLNKHTGAEEQLSRVRFAGNFAGCCALDADHVVLYSHASRRDASLFLEYRRHTGFGQAASLYEIGRAHV